MKIYKADEFYKKVASDLRVNMGITKNTNPATVDKFPLQFVMKSDIVSMTYPVDRKSLIEIRDAINGLLEDSNII